MRRGLATGETTSSVGDRGGVKCSTCGSLCMCSASRPDARHFRGNSTNDSCWPSPLQIFS